MFQLFQPIGGIVASMSFSLQYTCLSTSIPIKRPSYYRKLLALHLLIKEENTKLRHLSTDVSGRLIVYNLSYMPLAITTTSMLVWVEIGPIKDRNNGYFQQLHFLALNGRNLVNF